MPANYGIVYTLPSALTNGQPTLFITIERPRTLPYFALATDEISSRLMPLSVILNLFAFCNTGKEIAVANWVQIPVQLGLISRVFVICNKTYFPIAIAKVVTNIFLWLSGETWIRGTHYSP